MADPVETQPLEVSDFSGGKTDNYIGNPNSSQFQDADNMVLKKYGNQAKLFTREGSLIYDSTYYRIPANDRVAVLAENEGALFQGFGRNIYTISSGWVTVAGPTSNPVFSSAGDYISWAKWNKHLLLVNDAYCLPQKIYDSGSGWKSRTLGLPAVVTSGISASLTAGGASLSYVYAFIRADSYTIDTVTFREVSEVATKTVSGTGTAIAGGAACSITSIPSLSNGATGNYNTTSSTIEIYRTTNGGQAFYYVGQVTNGTTSFSDTVTDATLQTNAALYTEGGVVDFEQAPACKYVVVVGDRAYYLNVKEGSEERGNRVRQSIPGALYASPSDFYADLPEEITGGSSVGTTPVVFSSTRFGRIEGVIDEFGQGEMIYREISDTVGCVSHRSIVKTPDGIYFAAQDGFYFTDGFGLKKVSDDFNTSYAEIVATSAQSAMIYGAYDPFEKRIWWAAQRDDANADNDIVFVAHLQAPNTPFTTLSGGEDNVDNFAPTSLLFFNNQMLRGDRRGYLFKHDPDTYTDPLIDTTTAPTNWSKATIIYDYRSCAYDFGTTKVRKWVPRIVVSAENATNLSLQVMSNNDNTGVFAELSEIKNNSNLLWGDEDALWGDDNIRWNYSQVIEQWRRFPSPIRCSFKQVRLTNALTLIEDYSSLGTCSSDGAANTLTLDGATKEWSAYAVGYFVAFDTDDYATLWEVSERTSDTVLTVLDPSNTLATLSGRNFRIYGYKKSEVLNLLSYAIDFSLLTMTQQTYRTQGA